MVLQESASAAKVSQSAEEVSQSAAKVCLFATEEIPITVSRWRAPDKEAWPKKELHWLRIAAKVSQSAAKVSQRATKISYGAGKVS